MIGKYNPPDNLDFPLENQGFVTYHEAPIKPAPTKLAPALRTPHRTSWDIELRGRNGIVYMKSPQLAVAYTDNPQTFKPLLRQPFTSKHRDCRPEELEVTFLPTKENIQIVGKLLMLRRSRTKND